MNIKDYKAKIRAQLLGDLNGQANKQKKMETGEYRAGSLPSAYGEKFSDHAHLADVYSHKNFDRDYDKLIRRFDKLKGHVISMKGHADANYGDKQGYEGGAIVGMANPMKQKYGKKPVAYDNDSSSDSDDSSKSSFKGGKFHFVKSLKHVGSELATGVKKAAVGMASKEIATAGINALKSGASSLMASAPEAMAVGEEIAPLALMAAGMKKPKRTRRVSEKERNRHELVRKLMQQHHCSMASASSYIKQNNLKY